MSKGMQAAVAVALSWLIFAGASVAASPPPPLEAFASLPNASNVEISPSGRRVAFVSKVASGRKLIVAEDDKPIYANEIGEAASKDGKAVAEGKIRRIDWVDDDHLLVTVQKTQRTTLFYVRDKYELGHVLAINLKTKSAFWVFQGQHFILQSVIGYYGFSSAGGRVYGYFSGQGVDAEEHPERRIDLFRVDLDSGQAEIVARGPGQEFERTWLVGADGSILATSDFDALTQGVTIYGGDAGAPLAHYKDALGAATLHGQGRASGSIVYEVPTEVGVSEVYEVGLAKGSTPSRLFAGERAPYPLFDFTSRLMSGVATEGDHPDRSYFDPVRQARWAAAKKAFGGGDVQLVSNDAGFGRLIVRVDGEGDAGAYWLIDSVAGSADSYANIHPAIPSEAVGPRRMVTYKASDGLEIHGVLTLPPGRAAKNLPVVVMPHDDPNGYDDVSFDWLAAAFASRGYAVFQPNYRGSGGDGDAVARAGYGEWGRKAQTDISDGLADLAAKGVLDPKRACAVGWGYGGEAALAGTTLQHGLYRCVVSIAGVSDLLEMRVHITGLRSKRYFDTPFWRVILMPKPVGDDALRAISPAAHAETADAPVLLIHGADDTSVPISQSEAMERALKRAGKPVELVRIEGEDHFMSHEAGRTVMLKAAVAFVEAHNPAN